MDDIQLADGVGWTWIVSKLVFIEPNFCLPVAPILDCNNHNPIQRILFYIFLFNLSSNKLLVSYNS